jgi:hypothetical protein
MIGRVWQNPAQVQFGGLRGLLTKTDLYVWQSMPHQVVEQATAIDGMRLSLRTDQVLVNHETAAFPEHFPWVFPNREQAEAMDIEDRRQIVIDHLKLDAHLNRMYPTGFAVAWYA